MVFLASRGSPRDCGFSKRARGSLRRTRPFLSPLSRSTVTGSLGALRHFGYDRRRKKGGEFLDLALIALRTCVCRKVFDL